MARWLLLYALVMKNCYSSVPATKTRKNTHEWPIKSPNTHLMKNHAKLEQKLGQNLTSKMYLPKSSIFFWKHQYLKPRLPKHGPRWPKPLAVSAQNYIESCCSALSNQLWPEAATKCVALPQTCYPVRSKSVLASCLSAGPSKANPSRASCHLSRQQHRVTSSRCPSLYDHRKPRGPHPKQTTRDPKGITHP